MRIKSLPISAIGSLLRVMRNAGYVIRDTGYGMRDMGFAIRDARYGVCGFHLPFAIRHLPFAILLSLTGINSHADESLCAVVKIEIQQELTLERQAFDAHMRINNGLPSSPLTSVNIDVLFEDAEGNTVLATSDPSNTNALFFIRVDHMQGIADVNGSGTVAASTSADIHWLIIPSHGAGGDTPSGLRYFVGATLSYDLDGDHHEMNVTPDSIFVKPMPSLVLDYFPAGGCLRRRRFHADN